MNLYGEVGNVLALKRFIERQNVNAEIHFLTVGDHIDFEKYDFYYIGAGSEESQQIVLDDLMPYRPAIAKAVDNGKMFLATGNAMELFGRMIRLQNGRTIDCLGTFDYQATEQANRLVSEIFYKYESLPEGKGRDILGFKNCRCNIVNNNHRMFEFANNVNIKNFYGMNFVGPFLIRNPYFTDMLLKKLFEGKGYNYVSKEDTIEFKAYHEFVKNFITDRTLD